MAAASKPIPPGRRLRLDRRKALLDQGGLARLLDTTVEEVSLMEQNKKELTPAALAFISNPPSRVPAGPPAPTAEKPAGGGPKPPEPADEATPSEGPPEPTPSPERPTERAKGDQAPRPLGLAPVKPRKEDIKELEAALLKFFAGESFLVPKEHADGTVTQIEATIPGLAQMVGMVDEFDGQIIQMYAPGMARAWAQLAEDNPKVHRWLNAITYGGAYRGVLAATLPAVMAIVMHHGAFGIGQEKPIEVEHTNHPGPNGY